MLRNTLPRLFLVCILSISIISLSIPIEVFAQTDPGTTQGTTQTTLTPTTQPSATFNPGEQATTCFSWANGFSLTGCIISIFNAVFGLILKFINWMLSFVLWLASLIFDFTIYFTIVKFKTNFSELKAGGVGTFLFGNNTGLIDYLWRLVRDFLNIIIFLIIIYTAVFSMFEGFENTRKKFIALLVFSIIANFSLLFVKLAIDFSNIVALQAYTLAVKPKSTASFSEFRNIGGEGVTSYGEYIMNSIDLNRLTDETTGTEVAKKAAKDLKDTFLFQLGKMIAYIGVIYVLLYMAGFLILRAGILLFSMIVSPLIAAEMFFKIVDPNDNLQPIGLAVRNATKKVKGDFYDALLKGPLLIFFVFLIGVLAENIIGQGVYDTLNSATSQIKDGNNVDTTLTKSLFVFFKFGIFLALCKILFDLINKIEFAGEQTNILRKAGGRFANFALGRGISGLSRAGGALGRNTLGRAATGNNSFSRGLDWLNNKSSTWKTGEGLLKRTAGKIGVGVTNSLKLGTYDARNALNNKLGSKLKENVDSATTKAAGDPNAKINFGTAETLGYEAQLKKRQEDAAAKIKKDSDEAGKDLRATQDQIQEAKDIQKIDKDSSLTLTTLEQALSNPGLKDKIMNNPNSTSFSAKDIEILQGAVNKDTAILNKIDQARDKAGKEVDKKVQEERNKIKEKISQQLKDSIKPGASFMQRNMTRTGSSMAQIIGDGLTGNRTLNQEAIEENFRRGQIKNVKDEAKKAAVFNEITRELKEVESNIEKTMNIDFVKTDSPEYKDRLKKLIEVRKVLDEIDPKGKDDEEKIKLFKKYTEDPSKRDQIIKAKKDGAEIVNSFLETEVKKKVEENISDLEVAYGLEKNVFQKKLQNRSIRDMKSYLKSIESMSSNAGNYEDQIKKLEEKVKANFGEKKVEDVKADDKKVDPPKL